MQSVLDMVVCEPRAMGTRLRGGEVSKEFCRKKEKKKAKNSGNQIDKRHGGCGGFLISGTWSGQGGLQEEGETEGRLAREQGSFKVMGCRQGRLMVLPGETLSQGNIGSTVPISQAGHQCASHGWKVLCLPFWMPVLYNHPSIEQAH